MPFNYSADVGTRYDSPLADTLYGRTIAVYNNLHSTQHVYPTLANGVTLTTGTLAWALGAKTEIVPTGAIATPFDIHFMNVGFVNNQTTFEVQLFSGEIGHEVLISMGRTTRTDPFGSAPQIPICAPIMLANTRISAAIAEAQIGSGTMVASIYYNPY
jgi:hypothetical protein